ncbi:HAMP domain-containing sensor histidine kinase [Nocardioides sp. SYSU D00065]|uniref:sensor histidine kinase n=1 Tax=Nocardioides sp. SYSU D00065 TaxID=2817378 RepID=UPI001B31C2D1|nr:HAMP domain-containing sensor histidine kinase [Nocardioides sp. SYSU D00065]
MIEHASLQYLNADAPVSREASDIARAILQGDISIDEAITRTALHLLAGARVEVVVSVLTRLAPEDPAGWTRLGERAWIREWVRPGSGHSIAPPPGAGPEAALSMPWLSGIARDRGIVAITDRELLPSEAAQDQSELGRVGIRSLVASVCMSEGVMFGSMSAASLDAGTWSDELMRDFDLLSAAVASRLTLEQSRRALAEAIETGTQAQLAYQQLYGSVGHELRTPLAAILGYTEVLLDDAEHGTAEQVAQGMLRDGPVILRACEQLVAIVDTLLGAGRTLSGDDERQAVAVADAVADVVHWHRAPARIAGVEILVDIDASTAVWAHPSGVRQVLTNLLGNAIAHHRPGGGTVLLSAERLLGESGRPMVRVVVRDDGPGLEPGQLERAFEPFVRFAGPATKGTGLGLSISRTIAERDGGAVRGESTPGSGSSFWLELPAFDPIRA